MNTPDVKVSFNFNRMQSKIFRHATTLSGRSLISYSNSIHFNSTGCPARSCMVTAYLKVGKVLHKKFLLECGAERGCTSHRWCATERAISPVGATATRPGRDVHTWPRKKWAILIPGGLYKR